MSMRAFISLLYYGCGMTSKLKPLMLCLLRNGDLLVARALYNSKNMKVRQAFTSELSYVYSAV